MSIITDTNNQIRELCNITLSGSCQLYVREIEQNLAQLCKNINELTSDTVEIIGSQEEILHLAILSSSLDEIPSIIELSKQTIQRKHSDIITTYTDKLKRLQAELPYMNEKKKQLDIRKQKAEQEYQSVINANNKLCPSYWYKKEVDIMADAHFKATNPDLYQQCQVFREKWAEIGKPCVNCGEVFKLEDDFTYHDHKHNCNCNSEGACTYPEYYCKLKTL